MQELILVKVGSEDRPASQAEIDALATTFKEVAGKNNAIVVTGHTVVVEVHRLFGGDTQVVAQGNTNVV